MGCLDIQRMNVVHLSKGGEINRIHGLAKRAKSHSLDILSQSPILSGMKRLLSYLAIGAIILSLCSCASMGRFLGGRFGQPVPVYR